MPEGEDFALWMFENESILLLFAIEGRLTYSLTEILNFGKGDLKALLA